MNIIKHIEKEGVTKENRKYLIILFNGHRCGYVQVRTDEDIDEMSITCHGGITYSDTMDDMQVIGFDCIHSGDRAMTPDEYRQTLEQLGYDNVQVRLNLDECKHGYYPALSDDDQLRSLDYVQQECINISDQLGPI